MPDIELARGWTVEKVRDSLNSEGSRMDLIDFIRAGTTSVFSVHSTYLQRNRLLSTVMVLR